MAIFNKLGELAKNVSTKTGDMLEISKLNAQIRTREDDIDELKQQLGEYMWTKYDSGVIMDTKATNICAQIRAALCEIESNRAAIQTIRAAQDAAREQAEQEAEARTQMRIQTRELVNEVRSISESAAQPTVVCPACGAPIVGGARFCGVCGTRLS